MEQRSFISHKLPGILFGKNDKIKKTKHIKKEYRKFGINPARLFRLLLILFPSAYL